MLCTIRDPERALSDLLFNPIVHLFPPYAAFGPQEPTYSLLKPNGTAVKSPVFNLNPVEIPLVPFLPSIRKWLLWQPERPGRQPLARSSSHHDSPLLSAP